MAFAIVNGEVARVFWDEGGGPKGASVFERFQRNDGEEGRAYYSAFFDEPHGLEEGDTGKFSGRLGVKPNTYEKNGETKHGVDVTINATRFTPADADDEAPF